MEIESKLRDFILENYLFTDDQSALNNDDSFLEKGIIDSTGVLELVFFLEEEFSIQVDDDEVVPENLDSVVNVIRFVGNKLG
jgi:acyl carrier protein